MTPGRLDSLWAAAAGGTAFVVYVRTLAPGLVAVVDAPMFQFIGRVLGVPHNPGYPLYVLLTYPFSYLPIGSLPYRINLFSALFGALTVSLTFLVARELGCRRVISLAAALGSAFGHIFWSQSLIAEVYTLDSAIVAGMLLALIAWGRTHRPGWFFASVALLAAGLGNHTTILGFAPGMAAYALLKDRRFVTRARTIVASAVIVVAGLLQYLFILVRSRQPGAYLESRATTPAELLDVMTGSQFRDRLFAFEWRAVVAERVPWVVERILATELTLAGLALASVGAIWLLRRRPAEALLLLLGCGAIIAFALNYSVVDTPVFLIPATLVLWILAGTGAELAARGAQRYSRAAAAAVGLAALLVPAWHLSRNFAVTDRSRDTEAAVHFEGLFDALPDRAALVREDFLVDRMVMFKLLGDDAAKGRQIELVPRSAEAVRGRLDDGFSVFGFQKSVRRLRYEALNFGFAPLPLTSGRLSAFLSRLPDDTVVAVAVSGRHAERFAASGGVSFAAIGGPGELDGRGARNVVGVGVRGARAGAIFRSSPADVRLDVAAGGDIGRTGAVAASAIGIRAGAAEAAIRQGSRDIVRTEEGVAVALWSPDGTFKGALTIQASDDYRVPISPGALSVYPLRGAWPDQRVADGWTDLAPAVRTGSAMLRVAPGAELVLYCADDHPMAPRVIERSSDDVSVEVAAFEGAARAELSSSFEADALKASDLDERANVYRIRITASGRDPVSVLLALGAVPSDAIGRAPRSGSSGEVTAYSIDTQGLLRTPDRASEVLLFARDEQSQLPGHGWSPVDWDTVSPYRWMTAREAKLVLPIVMNDAGRIRIQALLEETGAATAVSLRLNGTDLSPLALFEGWHTYEWDVPAGALRQGTNEVTLIIDRLSQSQRSDAPPRGIAVTELRVISGGS